MQSLKERGVKLGKPENLTEDARLKGTANRIRNASTNDNNRKAMAMIAPLREKGMSYQLIADKLNALGFVARRGGQFTPIQVQRLHNRTA